MTGTFSDDIKMAPATKARYDKPQPYLGVLARFPRAILEIAKVSKYGTSKHHLAMGDMTYLVVPQADVNYIEAEVRHLLHEAISGPVNAGDGGLLHKAQKAWEALADLEVYLYQAEEAEAYALEAMAVEEARPVGGSYSPYTRRGVPNYPNSNPLDD